MISRRSKRREVRRCEPTVEALGARIAPAGFHAGSLFVAGMTADVAGGGTGFKHGHSHDGNGGSFLLQRLERKGQVSLVVVGQSPTRGKDGSNAGSRPSLNLMILGKG